VSCCHLVNHGHLVRKLGLAAVHGNCTAILVDLVNKATVNCVFRGNNVRAGTCWAHLRRQSQYCAGRALLSIIRSGQQLNSQVQLVNFVNAKITGNLLAHDQTERLQKQVHSFLVRVLLEDRVVHALLNEQISELNVLFLVHFAEVVLT